jgi:hypothetical protein
MLIIKKKWQTDEGSRTLAGVNSSRFESNANHQRCTFSLRKRIQIRSAGPKRVMHAGSTGITHASNNTRPYHAFEPLEILEAKYADAGSPESEEIDESSSMLKPVLKKPMSEAREFANVLEHVYREYKQQKKMVSPVL